MRTSGRALGVAILMMTALAPTLSSAGRLRAGGRGALLERAMDRLELSADQRSGVEAVLAGHRAEMRRQIEAVMDRREAQLSAMRAQPLDEARIRAAVSAVGAARADLAVTRARIASEVRALLSAEQRARLDEMLETVRALSGRARMHGEGAGS
jgi:Spy/CpxP family protein refolding chaperone